MFRPVTVRTLTQVDYPMEFTQHGMIRYGRLSRQINGLADAGLALDFSFITQPFENLFERPGKTFSNIIKAAPRTITSAVVGYGVGNSWGALTGASLSAWGSAGKKPGETISGNIGTQLSQGLGYGILGGTVANIGKGAQEAYRSENPIETFFSATGQAFTQAPIGKFVSGWFAPSQPGQSSNVGPGAAVAAAIGLPLLAAGMSNKSPQPQQRMGGAEQVQALAAQGVTDPNTIAQATGMAPQTVAALQALLARGYNAQQANQALAENPGMIPQLAATQAGLLGSINPWVVAGGIGIMFAMYVFMNKKKR